MIFQCVIKESQIQTPQNVSSIALPKYSTARMCMIGLFDLYRLGFVFCKLQRLLPGLTFGLTYSDLKGQCCSGGDLEQLFFL